MSDPAPNRPLPPSIDCQRYPALEELRQHCVRNGPSLIDRAYTEALALHKGLRELRSVKGDEPR